MILYKNVDIADLESILKSGVLTLDEVKSNWEEGKRANNATDKVYLFEQLNDGDSFTQYGAALLEVEVDAEENEFEEADVNKDLYKEFICDRVQPSQIKKIYIPELFKGSVEVEDERIFFCKVEADVFDPKTMDYVPATETILNQFSKTAYVKSTQVDGYFRGIDDKRHMIDLYNVRYL